MAIALPTYNNDPKHWNEFIKSLEGINTFEGLIERFSRPDIEYWRRYLLRMIGYTSRLAPAYRKFRLAVLERDNYLCRDCGQTENLEVHHIKSYKDYPHLSVEVDNGIVLCEECHKKTHKLLRKNGN